MTTLREDVEELARTFEHRATTQEAPVASATLMCARDLRSLLIRFEIEHARNATTEPGEPPPESGEPFPLPDMRSPRLPRIEE